VRIFTSLRWRIAALLNRLPGQCWTGLVMWANNGRDRRNGDPLFPLRPITWACRKDAESNGACWCNKVQR